MSPLRSSTYLSEHVDVSSPLTGLQTEAEDGSAAGDLPLRKFAVWPVDKRSEASFRPETQTHVGQRRHSRSVSADIQRPRSAGRRLATGDKPVMSRSRGGSPVMRRIGSSYGPRPVTVQDTEVKESTQAVGSECEGEFPWPETDRISSTIFITKTPVISEIGKILSGSPKEEVDPVFLLELTQHEKQDTETPSGPDSPSADTPVPTFDRSAPVAINRRRGHSAKNSVERWSPRSQSSYTSNEESSQRSLAETADTTPDPSISGDAAHTGLGFSTGLVTRRSSISRAIENELRGQPRKNRHMSSKSLEVYTPGWRYGTPEMSRGQAKLPILSPNELQPRPVVPGLGHPKHLPRAEKLPVSGYELLAAKLSAPGARPRPLSAGLMANAAEASGRQDPQIRPIYRRFEALNHRLLLHLQDELSELEEHLHRLDTADTQTRRLQGGILPASRRAESVAAGELQWHKTDILTKIGAKLNQYNQALASFSQTQQLQPAHASDIELYRSFLSTHRPIADNETRFLDTAEDLVSLSKSPGTKPYDSSSLPTSRSSSRDPSDQEAVPKPIPRRLTKHVSLPASPSPHHAGGAVLPVPRHAGGVSIKNSKLKRENTVGQNKEIQAEKQIMMSPPGISAFNKWNALLAFLAGILPMLLFRMFPFADFAARMMVVAVIVGVMGILGIAFLSLAKHWENQEPSGSGLFAWMGHGQKNLQQKGQQSFSCTSITDVSVALGVYAAFMGVVAVLFLF
ncbi:hypothetical protein V8F33_003515 [Rhypophila sp. PSN 637]